MSELIFEPNRASLPHELLGPLRDEFETGGLRVGKLAIGDIDSAPEMVFFLWHESSDVPVSMWMHRDRFTDDASARAAARDFLVKWNERLG